MRKTFRLIFTFLLVFQMAACGQNKITESNAAGNADTIPVTDVMESVQENEAALDSIGSEPIAEEERIVKAAFDLERQSC